MTRYFIILFLFIGQQTWASEAIKGAQKDYESFKKEMSNKVDSLGEEIEELKVKTKNKGHNLKQKTINEIESQRDELKESIDKIEDQSKTNWKKLKIKISKSMNSLNVKIQKALAD